MRSSKRSTIAVLTSVALILLFAVLEAVRGPGSLFSVSSSAPATTWPEDGASSGFEWVSVYFTDPDLDRNRGGPDAPLVVAIDQALVSVDVAAYELNLWSIRDALLAADRRGVAVRVVTDVDNLDFREVQQLKKAGIPVVGGGAEGLMHDKFIIIDRQEVWTGSMNFTLNGAYRNDNNLVRIRDVRLAADYLAEFEEMFVQSRFGKTSPANTPNPEVAIDDSRVEVFFAPEDGVSDNLVSLLLRARESIYFMAFSFTSDDLAAALLDRAQAGLTVMGVMDESQARSNTGGDYERFRQAGLEVYLDGNPDKMHHKVLIIDGKIVVTGSYNFSKSAETRNDENVLVIFNRQVAAKFLDEFARVFAKAKE